jgi:ATP-binding cassette subfamily F protein 3
LIVVSHAREFLNEVCTDTLHLHDKTIKRYKNCNYDEFEQVRYDQELVAERAAESQDKQIAHMQKFIDKCVAVEQMRLLQPVPLPAEHI